jgi:hypothetical protein
MKQARLRFADNQQFEARCRDDRRKERTSTRRETIIIVQSRALGFASINFAPKRMTPMARSRRSAVTDRSSPTATQSQARARACGLRGPSPLLPS